MSGHDLTCRCNACYELEAQLHRNDQEDKRRTYPATLPVNYIDGTRYSDAGTHRNPAGAVPPERSTTTTASIGS